MTEALVVAVNQAAAGEPNFICAARNHPDRYGRSEYLTIDVMGLVDDWSRPRVAIEHENAPGAPKLRYCLWKLLVVGAPLDQLYQTLRQWRERGVSQADALGALEAIRAELQTEAEAKDDLVTDLMDFVVGFCSPHMRLY